MRGQIIVLRKSHYATWLEAQPATDELARRGAALFISQGCSGCHAARSTVRAPKRDGIYGREVPLDGNRRRTMDDTYLRDTILQPRRDIVDGYESSMPAFEGLLDDADMQALIAYIRSLSKPQEPRHE